MRRGEETSRIVAEKAATEEASHVAGKNVLAAEKNYVEITAEKVAKNMRKS